MVDGITGLIRRMIIMMIIDTLYDLGYRVTQDMDRIEFFNNIYRGRVRVLEDGRYSLYMYDESDPDIQVSMVARNESKISMGIIAMQGKEE